MLETPADFGCYYVIFARYAAQCLADAPFAGASSIECRGVNKVDTRLECRVYYFLRLIIRYV